MPDLAQLLVGHARESKSVPEFWDRAATALRDASAAAHIILRYEGNRQRGAVKTGGTPTANPRLLIWSDDAGRRVEAEVHGLPAGASEEALEAALDVTAQLAT